VSIEEFEIILQEDAKSRARNTSQV
jgi:hypothetical protein